MGKLYPIGLVEVLPKDTFQHSTSIFMRFSPMAAPVMHPVTVRVHHMYVPHRILWLQNEAGGWENFITGGREGNNDQVVPTITTTGTPGDLLDYFNLPLTAGIEVSALPIRAFNMCFNEYFRDQDLVDERLQNDVTVPRVAWEKDYLTMARPFSQKGPAITLPLGTRAPIMGLGTDAARVYDLTNQAVEEPGGKDTTFPKALRIEDNPGGALYVKEDQDENPGYPEIYADLSSAEAIDINDFRRAFALQRFAEARAKYGSRYVEYLRYLGVRSSDARLQRPEYLGGGKVKVSVSEVLQTADDVSGPPDRFGVGDMYGHGVAHMRSNAYRRSFEEHGYVLSFLSVRPKAMYLNGITRTWLRKERNDFWQKELEQIGQQEILNAEVFADGSAADDATFGYQNRYQEYKREPNRVSSEFKTVLDYWHLGRDFATLPVLNSSFVECDPSKRIFNVQNQDTLWIAAQHSLVARRLVTAGNASRIL